MFFVLAIKTSLCRSKAYRELISCRSCLARAHSDDLASRAGLSRDALSDGRDMAEIGLMRDIAQRTLTVLAEKIAA
jgi:hypothetical protein